MHDELAPDAQMFANRLHKNYKHLARWARQNSIYCYRVYDADLPEFAMAIDLYRNERTPEQVWIHVQEYEPPKSVDSERAQRRLQAALLAVQNVFKLESKYIFTKTRRPQKGLNQYEKLAQQQQFYSVSEQHLQFLVNFTDYLDTGLFLDHRITRQKLAELAKGKHFLNLFAYTASATVYAASGGARTTTTVDMSNTYLQWAQRNMALNQLEGAQHQFIQANCIEWIEQQTGRNYDLIFLDPPSFSNSKRMQTTFDVQRDHVALLSAAGKLLSAEGILIFSNNFRRFKMDDQALPHLSIQEITRSTIPKDFARNQRIHHCWRIQRANVGS